jgi:hypothetical protein
MVVSMTSFSSATAAPVLRRTLGTAVPPADVTQLSNPQIAALTAAQIAGLSEANVKALSATQIPLLSKAAVAGFTGTQIGQMSATQLAAMKTTQITGLTAAAAGGLTADHIRAWSAAQVGAIGAGAIKSLSTTAAAALSSAQVNAVPAAAFKALSGAQLNAIGAAKIALLGTAQTAALGAAQIGGLNNESLGALRVSRLTTAQLSGLGADVAARLSGAQLQTLSAAQIGALSVAAAGALTAAQTDGFTTAQRAAMKATTVGEAGGLRITLAWGASTAKAPAGFRDAVIAAAESFTGTFSNNIRVNIQVGYGETHGTRVSASAAAQSMSSGALLDYATVRTALLHNAGNSELQATADASLGASDPTGGKKFFVSLAQEKALGLIAADATGTDGYIGLSSALQMDFTHSGAAGKFDAVGAIQHEISEVLGRVGSVGRAFGTGTYTALDMFRYRSAGVRALTAGTTGDYFSIDGGATRLGTFNATTGSDDYADWSMAEAGDPYGFSLPGVKMQTPARDVIVMAALGYNLTTSGLQAAQGAGVSVSV